MKKVVMLFLSLFLFFPFLGVKALELNTESIIVKDMDSGRIFYKKNENQVRLLASTTKVMTAIIAIENGHLEDIVTANDEVLKAYGSNIYIEKNEKMLLLDLIYGLMMRSGNDAALVIANHINKTEANFIKKMNQKAKNLGMNDTIYNNPHGLDDDTKNYSTASDLSKVYTYAYQNEIFKKIVRTKKYETSSNIKSYLWINRTKILKMYDKSTGGKTGYTPDAGRVLVTSASKNNLNLVAASFNSIYDYDLHIKLYEDIFNRFKNIVIVDSKKFTLKELENKGKAYIKNSIKYPLTEEEIKRTTVKIKISKNKELRNNDEIGDVYVYLDNKIIGKEKVYISISKHSLFTKIKSFFKELID